MSHIDYGHHMTAAATTPEEWFQPASRLTTYLNTLSLRTDLSVTVGPGVGLGSPACFIPSRGEIRIDTEICLPSARPDEINPADKLWRLEHPVFIGASGHEGAHAAHTRWSVEEFKSTGKITDKHLDVIMLLEEPRCEHRLIGRAHGQRLFLRATALDLILKDFELPETPYGAAAACALVLARVDGGTLEKKDGLAVWHAVGPQLAGKFDELEELWKRFLGLGDRDLPGMYSVARQWLDVLDVDPEGTDGLIFNLQPQPQPQPQGEGSSEGKATVEGANDWLGKAIGGAAVAADGALVKERSIERARRMLAAGEADADRRERAEKAADEAFPPTGAPGSTITAHRKGERPPTEEERRAATELAQRLLASEQQDTRDVARSARIRPPGRLRSREASQAAAYKDLGLHGHRPEMFRARDHVPDARGPLSIAFMLDISGSMGPAEAAISSTHWVVSHAGSRVGARVAVVHFGAVVHGIARPGQLDENVQLYDCSDPWEQFRDAFLAVDHELDLLDGQGARLLVIASDGQFRRDNQQKFAEAAMTMCKQKDVAVIWLMLTNRFISNYGHGAVLNMQGQPPVEIAVAVGNAAAAQMERLR
jgi:hypothetical protein